MTSRKGFDADGIPEHLVRWLDTAMRRVADEIGVTAAKAEAAGSPYLSPGPRASQRRVLSMIGDEGIRITDLARRAGMTKQAVGELVDGLESANLATSDRDSEDRRVRLVRRTPLGTQAVEEAVELIAHVEARLRRQVGAKRYDDMVQVLRELGAGRADR